jgi:hypothetical protein
LLRRATEHDIARIFEIRNSVRENRLNDPAKVTVDDVRWFIANPGIFLGGECPGGGVFRGRPKKRQYLGVVHRSSL